MAEYREFHCPYGDDFEGGDECDRCEKYELCMETPSANVIEVPDDATNGDVFTIMFNKTFPKTIVMYKNDESRLTISPIFSREWWNAPYKESEGK